MSPWPPKALFAITTFGAIIAAPQFIPQFQHWRIFEWATVPSVLDFQPRRNPSAPVEDEMQRLHPSSSSDSAVVRVHDPTAALDRFYDALVKCELSEESSEEGKVVRVIHFGDSPTTADLITSDVRAFLQRRFGNAGHGVYLIARPWAWYRHRGLDTEAAGWQIDPVTLRGQQDGFYGLAGVSFTGEDGAWSRIRLGSAVERRLKVSYLGEPGGGKVAVVANGTEIGTIETDRPEKTAMRQSLSLPAGTKELELHVIRGPVRLFSLFFETGGRGVTYSSIGLNGASAAVFTNLMNRAHWSEQLRESNPDLVVVNLGTNESGYANYVDTTYKDDLRNLIRLIHRAVPDASLLVMSPMDRGVREERGTIGTVTPLPRLVAMQAQVASEEGCAFFNTFESMGGPGTMGRWYMAEPRLVSADFIHPLPAGGRIVATLLYEALMKGYNVHKLKALRKRVTGVRQ